MTKQNKTYLFSTCFLLTLFCLYYPVFAQTIPHPPSIQTIPPLKAEEGLIQKAKDYLTKNLVQNTPPLTSEDGLLAEVEGDWPKALEIYQDVLKRNPDNLPLWLRVADMHWSLGNYSQTVEALTQVVRLNPDNTEMHFRLSQAYSVMQKPEPALQEVQRAVELDPKKVEYWEARGSIANWLGKYSVAIESFQKVMELDPKNADAEVNLARSQKWSGELTKSIGTYRSYLKKYPDKKDATLELAMAEAERGNYPAAEKMLKKYQTSFGQDDSSNASLARIYAWDDRPNLSFSLLDPLLKAKPNDYDLLYTKTVSLRNAERFPEALESLKMLEKLQPDSKEVYDTGRYVKTPIRSNISAGFNFYNDTDSVSIYHAELKGTYFATPLTSIYARAEYDHVQADIGSGLETIEGKTSIPHTALSLGGSHRFSSFFAADAFIGGAFTNNDSTPYYGLNLFIRPHDALKVQLTHGHDFYFPSPLALSLGIQRYHDQLSFEWRPDLAWTVTGSGAYNFFSRDNRQWEAELSPRRAVLRTEHLNLDLGISAEGQGFRYQDDTNGYYDPVLYQKYMITSLWYLKINDDNGISLSTGAGINKDDTMDGFQGAYEASLVGSFGIYRDVFLSVSLGWLYNLGQIGSYTGYSAGVSIIYRF